MFGLSEVEFGHRFRELAVHNEGRREKLWQEETSKCD